MSDILLVDDSEPGIRVLTLNRPQRLNALNGELVIRLLEVLDDCEAAGPRLRVVVLKGAGRAFCAGADLKWLAEGTLADHAAHGVFHDNLNALCNRLELLPQVVVGQIHGYALAGGLEVALCCDMLTVSDDAQLGDEHIRRNLIPGGGGSQRLPRKVGLARGLNMLLTGRRLSGPEAVSWGLACQSAPAAELDQVTMDLARGMAGADGHALATMKTIVRRGIEMPLADGLWLELYQQQRYRAKSGAMDKGVSDFAADRS
ncbi:enoyl-CoA hydratase/isomerase family protein [Dactylosporangium sp. AC04546]|uniref:enoyl-CoA hydratase/isomerase family protein n=1 Tax=Dactylosporangium sp. AC04546 TaxID=2862460 RepID=UPI001EE0B40E|nr:enoyl-CoA hydratase/isomerase family protein [Dactylosporangium sp. AC04546]WVK80891.1 enoyl-CoA hydratase/isomerase family protein [Dactylosporangium sp. AC04546]